MVFTWKQDIHMTYLMVINQMVILVLTQDKESKLQGNGTRIILELK